MYNIAKGLLQHTIFSGKLREMVNRTLVFLSLGVYALLGNNSAYANIASKEYVAKISDVKESLSNKTDTLDEASTTIQYPSAKSVYDNLAYRVDVRDSANQTLAGKYTVSGEFIVPDQPLPTVQTITETE